MKSQNSIFGTVPAVDVPRSSFNLSHGHKTTFDADFLVPILVQQVLPGDSFNVNATYFARLATPLHPILDNIYVDVFFFFANNRILWDGWEQFCGAQEDPADTIDLTIPKVDSNTTFNVISNNHVLMDYMGLPWVTSLDLTEINALPFRAYEMIWREWFRDQNLIDSPTYSTGNGPDSHLYFDLRKRAKKHDYFTSCLPWPQKTAGTDEITLPLGTSAPIENTSPNTDLTVTAVDRTETAKLYREASGNIRWSNTGSGYSVAPIELAGYTASIHEADLTAATSATINELRQAFQLQRLLERDARGGTRYVEHLKAHWKVVFPDYRAQRPEFLGSASKRVNVTPVANTAIEGTSEGGDVGRLGGFGTVGGQASFTKSFVEHGWIIGLINARSDITYQQGLERFWTADTRYDIFLPVLSGLGEMAVLNKEIFYQNTTADEDVFGYQESWADYRFRPNRLSGLFRSDHASTLDPWHLSEDFATLPTLGETFITSNTGVPLDRAIAVPSEPHFIADIFFDIKAARAMPVRGIPGMLDHF